MNNKINKSFLLKILALVFFLTVPTSAIQSVNVYIEKSLKLCENSPYHFARKSILGLNHFQYGLLQINEKATLAYIIPGSLCLVGGTYATIFIMQNSFFLFDGLISTTFAVSGFFFLIFNMSKYTNVYDKLKRQQIFINSDELLYSESYLERISKCNTLNIVRIPTYIKESQISIENFKRKRKAFIPPLLISSLIYTICFPSYFYLANNYDYQFNYLIPVATAYAISPLLIFSSVSTGVLTFKILNFKKKIFVCKSYLSKYKN